MPGIKMVFQAADALVKLKPFCVQRRRHKLLDKQYVKAE